MQVGVLLEPVKRWPGDVRPLTELYREAVETVEWLEDLGFDYVLFGEHHFLPNEWNPSTLALLAGVATRTSRIRIGVNVMLTPLYKDVIRLAEDIATIDLLSNGRMIPIFGAASTRHEFNTFGVDPAERFGRMFEVMQFVRQCFEGPESFDFDGRYVKVRDMRMTTQPVQRPLPIWYGGHGPKNALRAAKLGFHCASASLEQYQQGLAAAGLDIADFNVMAMSGGPVGSASELEKLRDDMDVYLRLNYEEYLIDPRTRRDLAFPPALLDNPPPLEHSMFASGQGRGGITTPDELLSSLGPTLKDSVATHALGGVPGTFAVHWMNDHRRCIELYAREVIPVLHTWGRQPVAHAKAGPS